MNKLKKIASLLLALVMALALAAPAFASGNIESSGTGGDSKIVTITVPDNGHTYAVYQIFTGDVAGDILSNVKWGQNGKNKLETVQKGDAVPAAVLDELKAAAQKDANGDVDEKDHPEDGNTDTTQLPVIENYVNLASTAFATVESGGSIQAPTGYYLIKDLGVPAKNDDGTVIPGRYETPDGENLSLYMVQVLGNVTITVKSGTTQVVKKIKQTTTTTNADGTTSTSEALVDVNTASIGDTIPYVITGTLPANYATYKNFYYEFVDVMGAGLTFGNDVKVELVNGDTATDITGNFVVTTPSGQAGTTEKTISIKCEDLKQVAGVLPTSQIRVTYSAVLNENATIGSTGNENTVKVIYSNNPNDTTNPKGETPVDKTVTFTIALKITKTDGDGAVLPGAEFTLEGNGVKTVLIQKEEFVEAADGNFYKLKGGTYTTEAPTADNGDSYESTTVKYKKVTNLVEKKENANGTVVGTVDETTGIVKFTGLNAGNYTLKETKTPQGYNTIADISFEITFGYTENADGTITGTFDADNGISLEDANTLATTIVNQSGAQLPSTGGIGTTIFYIVGGVLAAGAVILLITKRRMNLSED